MSEATQIEEEVPNPYNMNKPWHKPDGPPIETADQMFFEKPQQQATLEEEAPDDSAPKKRTNYKKRYDDLKRHYDDRVSEFKQKEQELVAAIKSAQPNYQAPKTQEELETFRKEYPDLYDTVETVAHLQSSEKVNQLQEQLQSIQQRETDILRREAEADLIARHPDFEDIRGSDEFHEWAKKQPKPIQEWIYNNSSNAELASKAIDLFKMENGLRTQIKSQPKERGSAADIVSTKTTTVDTKQPRIWTEREIAKMSLDQFDKYENEIQQAISEGRVVKD
tara:strand:+ start:36 stop:872 length:837 start_codon:yes stop_codon:yes gene_type:complete